MEREFIAPDLTKWRNHLKEDFDCEVENNVIFELANVLAEGCLQDEFQAYLVQSNADDEIEAIVSSLNRCKDIRNFSITAVDHGCFRCSIENSPVTITLWIDSDTSGEIIGIKSSRNGWISLLANEKGKRFLQTI